MWLQQICKGTFSFKRNPKLQAKPESFYRTPALLL